MTLSTSPRVLVVEDDESVLVTTRAVLELDGYHVQSATSLADAMRLVDHGVYDAVLTDLRLDGFDGLEILRRLRRRAPDTAGIVLTGFASLESAVDALRQGAYDYLVKPCDVLELRTTVARAIDRSRLAQQLRERVRELELANETIRSLNLELEQRVEQATAELRQQVRLRDDFMAGVSHDLKSPLTFIKGLASLRRRRAKATSQTRPLLDALEQIESSAGRIARQLDELVDASRLDAGGSLELRREPIDLVALARQVTAEHQQTSERHDMAVESTQPELVGLWDAVRLERVLRNLLGNAIKYSPGGGPVSVQLDLEGGASDGSVVVKVQDHGEGIPEQDLPHIFERFRRGENVSGRIPGTGIGLAGARQIVESHGGTIRAESRMGQGTTVTVRLPFQADQTG